LRAYGLPVKPTLAAYRRGYPGAGAGDLLAAIQTDWYWCVPALRFADAHARNEDAGATYMYEFGWRSPRFDGRLGACHSLEIPPQELADSMHAAWVAFASRGDCDWPKYDLTRRATRRFDVTSAVVNDPRCAERALWARVR
jgi:carboxylesterase type B